MKEKNGLESWIGRSWIATAQKYSNKNELFAEKVIGVGKTELNYLYRIKPLFLVQFVKDNGLVRFIMLKNRH